MDLRPVVRRRALTEAHRLLEERIETGARDLEAAPAWFRPDVKVSTLPRGLRARARNLIKLNDQLREDWLLAGELLREARELDLGRLDLRRCVGHAIEWLAEVRTARELRQAFRNDPINRARFGERKLSAAEAQQVLNAQRRHGGRFTPADLQQLAAETGLEARLIEDLVYTGCRIERAAPRPTVGVLFPLRLETRFIEPAGAAGWRLRLRVIPDDAWVERHDPRPTPDELASFQRYLDAANGDPRSPIGRSAWIRLVDEVGGARAAWLYRTVEREVADAGRLVVVPPAEIREEPAFSAIGELPPRLSVWLGRGGAAPTQIATLNVRRDQLRLDLIDPDEPEGEQWWWSWKAALDAGMAAEVDLGSTDPADIDVLYVTGLGGDSPKRLLQIKRDSGELGVLEPGTPTNTVHGEPTADLLRDPEAWLELALAPDAGGTGAQAIGRALTGEPLVIGAVPGDDLDHASANRAMVQALWPVLFGHAFADLWAQGEAAHDLGLWAGHNLLPEGPLPPIRLGMQPYGLLPATSLRLWQPDPADPAVEEALRPDLLRLRGPFAAIAEQRGNVVDASTQRLLDLIAQTASSSGYQYRKFISLPLLYALIWAFGGHTSGEELNRRWQEAARPVLDLGALPGRRYFAIGWPQKLRLPLVKTEEIDLDLFREAIKVLFDLPPSVLIGLEGSPTDVLGADVLHSLLLRLLVHARIIAMAEVVRHLDKAPRPRLEPIEASMRSVTVLGADALRFNDRILQQQSSAAARLYEMHREAAFVLLEQPVAALERVLRATLDAACYRLDPWITGYAWRRLETMQNGAGPVHCLGAYGWVDAPFRGRAGPTDAGFLHAPSQTQALVAAVLRDKALHDVEPDRWRMSVDSRAARIAERIAEEVRLGAPLEQVLGRMLEGIVGDPAKIDQLRLDFPVRTEHLGRRLADGRRALAGLLANPPLLDLSQSQRQALADLRAALDVYGDLLVAEAVHHVVEGRGGVAGSAMEAAAGLQAPPDLQVIKTPREGRSVRTAVAFALPAAAQPDPAAFDFTTSPGRLADPSVADFLIDQLGAPGAPAWRWRINPPDAPAVALGLADLGFEPIDSVSLGEDQLEALLLAGQPNGSTMDEAASPGRASRERARRLIEVMGARPALPEDLTDNGSAPPDNAVRDEFRRRIESLLDVGGRLRDAIAGRTAPTAELLRAAARWGIIPLRIDDADTDDDRLDRARAALDDRLAAAPQPGVALDNLSAPDLATAIAELAAPDGRLAVLARIPRNELVTAWTAAPLEAETGLPSLDVEWLPVVASVQRPLARLEMLQMERMLDGAQPFLAWSNRPGDPWQTDVVADADGVVPGTRLVALYGPAGAGAAIEDPASSAELAFGLVASFGETVPSVRHDSAVAFGFNAPGARAPQAILIAVPPRIDRPLDDPTLIQILIETRELARARAVRPEDLAPYAAGLSTIMLPAMGTTRVDLEPQEPG